MHVKLSLNLVKHLGTLPPYFYSSFILLVEHSAIHSTFIKLPIIIKIFVLFIFEWLFYTCFAVCHVYVESILVSKQVRSTICQPPLLDLYWDALSFFQMVANVEYAKVIVNSDLKVSMVTKKCTNAWTFTVTSKVRYNMGLIPRKPVFGALLTTKAQTRAFDNCLLESITSILATSEFSFSS